MKKAMTVKRELKYTYGIDIALCVFNFLICTVLCAGGSEWLNIAGVVAFVTALLHAASAVFECKSSFGAALYFKTDGNRFFGFNKFSCLCA